jgi:hypothetical protein
LGQIDRAADAHDNPESRQLLFDYQSYKTIAEGGALCLRVAVALPDKNGMLSKGELREPSPLLGHALRIAIFAYCGRFQRIQEGVAMRKSAFGALGLVEQDIEPIWPSVVTDRDRACE